MPGFTLLSASGTRRADRASCALDALERAIDDAFGDRLLAVEHDRIHELRQDDVPELGIGEDFALLWRDDGHCCPSHSGRYLSALLALFRALGAVLGARLPAVLDALRVEHAAKHVIAHARKVAHTAAADQHDAVLLEVVALAGDVADHFALVGQADLGDLAQRRVRLLRGRRIDTGADAALLRVGLQVAGLFALLSSVAAACGSTD